MDFAPIVKSRLWGTAPHMRSYELARRNFSWDAVRHELDGFAGGSGLNMGREAVDRPANSTFRDKVALRWLSKDGRTESYTYRQLADLTKLQINASFAEADATKLKAGQTAQISWSALSGTRAW